MRACRLGCLGPDELARAGWSGRAVASVSVWMPWSGRVDPNGLARRGCCERVGLDALERTSRPEWVGPEGLSRACRLGCLGPSEPTRMGWSVHGLDSFILVRDGRSLPAFPCAPGRCLPCFVPLSPMPRPHLLAPGRCLPVLRTAAFRALFRCLLCLARTSLYPGVAFLCFGLLPSVLCFAVSYASPVPPCTQVVASCSPRPASLSPRPRSFLFFGPLFPALRPALSYTLLHPPAPLPTLFCASARFLLLSSLCPRSSPCKRKPPKAWPSGVSGYCRSRITSQEPSG